MILSHGRVIAIVVGIAVVCSFPVATYAKEKAENNSPVVSQLQKLSDVITNNSNKENKNSDTPKSGSSSTDTNPVVSSPIIEDNTPVTSVEDTLGTDDSDTTQQTATTTPTETLSTTPEVPPTTPVQTPQTPVKMSPTTPEQKLPVPPVTTNTLPANKNIESAMEKFFNGNLVNYYTSDAFSQETTALLLIIASAFGILGLTFVSGTIEWMANALINNRQSIIEQKLPEGGVK
jgi:hypothetical protein